jgi:hypothetical protein
MVDHNDVDIAQKGPVPRFLLSKVPKRKFFELTVCKKMVRSFSEQSNSAQHIYSQI